MAGNPRMRDRALAAEDRVRHLEAQVAQLEARTGYIVRDPGQPRALNDSTRQELIREMLARADDGLSLGEIAALWNVSLEEVGEWVRYDVTFAAAAARARTRGRAAVLASMRRLLESGRGIPAAFSDRMLALHDVGIGGEDEASGLITIALPAPSDCESCPHCGADLGGHDERQTPRESDGA